MRKLRVLFIDDDEPGIGPARKELERSDYKCSYVAFPGFDAEIEDFQPHILVLDRMEGTAPVYTNTGRTVLDSIWGRRFCPVVIYTAFPNGEQDEREEHPLVKIVTKGGDLTPFKAAIEMVAPHARALESAEQHVREQFAVALRDVARYAALAFADPIERMNVVARHGRRRLAALMDEMTMGKLASWEQYIYPPVSGNLMLGDIIRLRAGGAEDATAFRVILTPSCDLVSIEGRPAKVKYVLVSKCCSPKDGIGRTALAKIEKEKLADALPSSLLSQGFLQKMVPFPALRGVVPAMMTDMKSLELLDIAQIDAAHPGIATFVRVAGLDSPFRELISWAYMQTACRPGLPDRDFTAWSKEIMDSYGA